ncbi:MAG: GDP-mannose 4,6-dehydratase [Bacillati bacterium ANGP1]|uniref:GDP-mannose 4,6-dehydratase n=1 Tax=Candidatus Segetimicrobium genomatis TaxID=2569760 RepID=A0A537IUI9_9BACT|nr:MAG: GDP-mannose 4,6-dehydratase [Terrabacteria group bacterium ANGP1]
MKVLVTGITGFAGSHLADYILAHQPGVEVHGTRRWRSKEDAADHLIGRVTFHECDITDAHNVYQVVEKVKPDRIFHLAAQSYIPASWDSPAETFHTNVVGQCNLLESIKHLRPSGYDPVVQIAGSSEEYGKVAEDQLPINESAPLFPLSPYAVSKVAQDYMGYQYWQSYHIRAIRMRAFSNFCKQIAEIEKEIRRPIIQVGNLEAIRDFTDVRDTVRAYWLATEAGEPGDVYNVASGQGRRIREVLTELLAIAKRTDIRVEQDPQRMRPSDVPVLVGDSTKFRRLTGWKPLIPFAQTIQDCLEYWRSRV